MPIDPIWHTDAITPHADTTKAGHTDTITVHHSDTPHSDAPAVHDDVNKIHTDIARHHIDLVDKEPPE